MDDERATRSVEFEDYEDYQETSRNYDRSRVPIGVEIILSCLASSAVPLRKQAILDGGCGTGNYLRALAGKVGCLYGLDLNPAMSAVANRKLADAAHVQVAVGSLFSLPYARQRFDGMLCNQVVHHLDAGNGAFPNLRRSLVGFHRVLRPGGVLVINTCCHRQLFDGYWYADLLDQAVRRVAQRYAPLDLIATFLKDAGFRPGGTIVPKDAILQGEAYLDPRAVLRKEFRDGDSVWALATETEANRALQRIEAMDRDGSLEDYFRERERRRQEVGQTTFVWARKAS